MLPCGMTFTQPEPIPSSAPQISRVDSINTPIGTNGQVEVLFRLDRQFNAWEFHFAKETSPSYAIVVAHRHIEVRSDAEAVAAVVAEVNTWLDQTHADARSDRSKAVEALRTAERELDAVNLLF